MGKFVCISVQALYCEVIARTDNSVLLTNRNGEIDTHFELSNEEFERVTF